ncbi:MAG: TauD/TfdA family dioxygenase [Novosphingobium sp.]|nr:TauD/TfdA family dioxygenase [Novosphingobium sp.]
MQFRSLHPEFGVEVLEFDIHRGGTPEEIAQLREAYDRHQMLLFRGQGRIAPQRHVELTSWFGPPAPVSNVEGDNCVSVLQNGDDAGSMKLPFHSDMTYTDDPVRTICLQAIALPDAPTSTTYVSGMAAWDALPEALQAELADKTLRHFYSTRMADFDWPDFIAEHPVRKLHPRNGRPILFVTENHAERILECDESRSDQLIEELFDYLYAPERKYEHVWQKDDLLLWDNLALQHARTKHSDPVQGKRALQRVALCDTALPELIERARAREVLSG